MSPNTSSSDSAANANQNSSKWDLGKFYQTLTYFEVLPWLQQIDVLGWLGTRNDPKPDPSVLAPLLAIVVGDRGMVGKQLTQFLGNSGYRIQSANFFAANATSTNAVTNADVVFLCLDALLNLNVDDSETLGNLDPNELIDRIKSWLKPDQDRMLFDFRQAGEQESATNPDQSNTKNLKEIWGILDDVVMGGVSASNITLGDRSALFYGNVSTANSGGFASVRSRNFEPGIDLSAYDGIALRVRGDGKRYKFMLRDSGRWDGIAFCASFDTVANNWIDLKIPFDRFAPIFRAKTVKDAEPIATEQICAFQLMLSKFEYDGALNPRFEAGSFRLEVEYIKAYSSSKLPQLVVVSPELNINPKAEHIEKIENQVRRSGIPYTIAKPIDLTDSSQSQAIALGQLEQLGQQNSNSNQSAKPPQPVSSLAIAQLCIEALKHNQATQKTYRITALPPKPSDRIAQTEQSKQTTSQTNPCAPGDWDCQFARLTPDIIGIN
ncbi:NADH:ubiquinone oxidoreductase complex I intermediate-associated protein 30 [Thalassoporum mexicanum PCC 7367]|uniref:CIA30 family protein n=1 Tax=Thalassoporum mexicanum TaxID=3457544 RepID=UPI00029F8962|nr:CIA30 family protein [Pseudanabaena sp. PCC 7367]AFY68416.1 NADH:ubiquinone oxidoreductase complex I intermediate-associated protein 30 [Pseudanabaena sp. PCC 7367]